MTESGISAASARQNSRASSTDAFRGSARMRRKTIGALGLAAMLLALAPPLVSPDQAGSAMAPLIFHGTKAEAGELPSLAFVSYSSEWGTMSCTGTVVSPMYVLTAKHCARHDLVSGGLD